MDSKTYWQQREAAQRQKNIADEAQFQKELTRIYSDMMDSVQKELESFYAKYASSAGITLAEAKKKAAKADIEAYSRKAEKYVREKNFSTQANAEMKLYNLTMKANRLELLKANMGLELVSGFDEMQQFFDETLTDRTLSEFERQAGILGKSVSQNVKAASAIVNASFHNASFSDRIWMYQDVLKEELARQLATGLIQGKSAAVLAQNIRDRFGVSLSDAKRLMNTELRRVQTEAARESYERNGNTEYMFLTANAKGPCAACRALDGKVYKVKDMMPGVNAPPIHPNCHCCTAPHWDEETFQNWLDTYSEHGMEYNEYANSVAKSDGTFHTYDDPIREILGSAFESHPKETQEIIDEMTAKGVKIVYRDGVMGYQPGTTSGKRGQIVIDKAASYSAWLHERQHVYDDEASGWLGFRNLEKPGVAAKFEERAYDIEIEFARKLGYNNIVKRLEILKQRGIEEVKNR